MMVNLSWISVLAIGLALLQATVCSSHPLTGPRITEDLRAQLSPRAEVVNTTDSAVWPEEFRPRYNIVAPPTYIVAVKPATVGDVQKLVKYASKNKVPILATGGGHGYSTSLGKLQAGIDIDLSNFNSIKINAAAGTMTIGGSVRADQVAAALQVAGMEIPVPQCPCVGFAGASLGGGVGPYSGLYGPISDSLLSVEFVTGNGKIICASRNEHSDLFFAIKGAGFNYGVATSLTYRIYPATNGGQAMNADMIFPGRLNGTIWQLIKSLADSQPKELSTSLSVRYSPDPTLSGIIITANFVYAGAQNKGLSLIKPFLDLQPLNVNISTVPWNKVPDVASYGAIRRIGCNPGVRYIPFGVNLYEVDVDNLVSVVDYMQDAMSKNKTLQNASIVWQQYSRHGFQLRKQDSSAFPFRDAKAFVQIGGVGIDQSQIPPLSLFTRSIRDLLQRGSGRDKLEVFVHFAHGDEPAASWYSATNIPALLRAKGKYDPAGLFSWYNPVR